MQSKQEFLAAVHIFYLHCKDLNIITLSFIKKENIYQQYSNFTHKNYFFKIQNHGT